MTSWKGPRRLLLTAREKAIAAGRCTGPCGNQPPFGSVGVDLCADCPTCGKRVKVTVRGLYAHHKAAIKKNSPMTKRKPPPANDSNEAVRLRRAALAFAKLGEPTDDNDLAGVKANRELLAAGVAYAEVVRRQPTTVSTLKRTLKRVDHLLGAIRESAGTQGDEVEDEVHEKVKQMLKSLETA